MQLAGRGVFGPPRDRAEVIRVLERCVELGIDHLDTAQYYGPDVVNDLLREVLHPYDGITLVSKVGARRDERGGWLSWNRPEDLRQGIQDNLRSLGVDRLGAVNLRIMDGVGADGLEAQVEAVAQAREDGLVAAVGVSNVTLEQLQLCLGLTEVVCVQNPYSFVDRSSEPVLRECERRGIAFVPFFPLGSGFGIADVRGHPLVVAAATELGATPAQVALAWTLQRSPAVLLIPGTSSVAHLEENVAAVDLGAVDLP